MGEVYKARDTRLDRAVAIKILPAEFAHNAQFKVRFEREAKTISQLSHPNICTLYDVGENYIVMELLDGESLADRLSKGPLPLREVLKYGVQIAEALGKAHREGVIHRDLKPGNVMITKAGAKLLDFGLAKGGGQPPSAVPDATVQKPLTAEGTVLGTFQYMAPEQLAGEEPDARTDIFALGAVLYEMATGKRAFEGKTKTSLIAAIVSGEPKPMAELQPLTPPALEHVVKKCVAKERDDRWQSAIDVAEELRWISEAGSQAGVATPFAIRRRVRERLAWSIAAVLAIAVAVFASLYWRAASHKTQLMRFSIALPPNTDTFRFDSGGLALSPDGLRVVMSLRTISSGFQLWIRSVDSLEAVPLPETAGAHYPFWSPDGKFIGFFAGGKLKKIAAEGGPVQVICDAPSGRGGTWAADGTILLVPDIYSPISKVASAGGTPTPVTSLDRNHDVTHRWPSFLPDGRHFIYVSRRKEAGGNELASVVASSLDSPAPKRIIDNASNPSYSAPGWLVFSRGESLMAVRFDARNLRTIGEPLALPIGKVGYYPDRNLAYFATSAQGTLVYLPPNRPLTQMRWLDRDGKILGSEEQPGYYVAATVSPDGKRVAFTRTDDGMTEHADIWLHDIGTTNTSRFTFDGHCGNVRWSSDGKRLFYASTVKGRADLYSRPVAGSARTEAVCISPRYKETFDVSPDGKYVIDGEQFPDSSVDLMLVSLADHSVSPFLRTPGSEQMPAFSPDGRWIAYAAVGQIYVRRFPDTGEQWQVSTGSGYDPKWSRDAKTIFFTAFDGMFTSVSVRTAGSLNFDPPRSLFRCDISAMPEGLSSPVVAVSKDAQQFLVVTKTESRETPFQVVLNWQEMVKGR
jgi:serine/threonine protein kinase